MKKNLFLMFGLGVSVLFGACSQDDVVESDGGKAAGSVVCFSSGSHEATRTSMDPDGTFYWTSGDYIFVKNGSSYVPSDNHAGSRVPRANFYVQGTFNADSYPVVYTGTGKNSAADATSVEVKDQQAQAVADNADHLGSCGDCGNCVATKTDNFSYKFDLIHRASYFVIAPRHTFEGKTVTLQKVEVTTSDTDDLCGIYNFDETTTTLKGNLSSGGKKTITLTTSDFAIPTVADVDADNTRFADARGYMVFQPGTHTLTFKYYVTIDGTAREFIKTVTSREFRAGYFTNVKHILADGLFNGGHKPLNIDDDITDDVGGASGQTVLFYGIDPYYEWDAKNPFGSSSDAQWNTARSWLSGQNFSEYSCKDMPNANEMYWYVVNGDPHWDEATPWSIDGGLTEHTGGIWLKKKATILADGKTFRSDAGKLTLDMRTTHWQYENRSDYTTQAQGCKTTALSDAERSKYFFLPALGYYIKSTPSQSYQGFRRACYYWSSNRYTGDLPNGTLSFVFMGGPKQVRLWALNVENGCVAGYPWFK